MRKIVRKIGLCILAVPLAVPLPGMATVDLKSAHVPGELIIKLKDGVSVSHFVGNKQLNSLWSKSYHVGFGDLVHVKVSDKADLGKTISSIAAMEGVEYVEPNYIYTVGKPVHTLAPNDPRFGQLWGLNNTGNNSPDGTRGVVGADIQAFRAWEITKGSRQVKIAVIDTGIDYNHEDLKANIWTNEAEANGKPGVDDDNNGLVDDVHGYDFANKDGDPLDGHGHGTHVSGTIGAVHDNGIGVAGVMADVTMVAVKFLSDAGSGTTADAVLA
ncbi:MAG: S8 family serine peptidase, partial [Bdellovibrionota bacterium]